MNATNVATRLTRNKAALIAVVGATAVGKTATSIRLARDLGGEVVSADSRYLYRGMDIGTATPSAEEMAGIRHHLINILDPTDDYSLSLYQRDAYRTIDEVLARGKIPILAGGTPLYVNAVLQGWRIPEAPPNPEFRVALEQRARADGPEVLYDELAAIDPAAAERISVQNVRRVIRALEIHHVTGRRMSELEGREPPPFETLIIGLNLPREELFRRIDERVDGQIRSGLVEEVARLRTQGVPADAPAMSAIGYPQVAAYLNGVCSLDEAIERIKFDTHRYVRHQQTWLRRMEGVHWFDPRDEGYYERILKLARTFVANETNPSPSDVG